MDKDPMWFFDETPEDYKDFRKKAKLVEREYLEIRQVLQKAEESLRVEPENATNQAKVKYLQKRLKDLEEKEPWLVSGISVEYALWGTPH